MKRREKIKGELGLQNELWFSDEALIKHSVSSTFPGESVVPSRSVATLFSVGVSQP